MEVSALIQLRFPTVSERIPKNLITRGRVELEIAIANPKEMKKIKDPYRQEADLELLGRGRNIADPRALENLIRVGVVPNLVLTQDQEDTEVPSLVHIAVVHTVDHDPGPGLVITGGLVRDQTTVVTEVNIPVDILETEAHITGRDFRITLVITKIEVTVIVWVVIGTIGVDTTIIGTTVIGIIGVVLEEVVEGEEGVAAQGISSIEGSTEITRGTIVEVQDQTMTGTTVP